MTPTLDGNAIFGVACRVAHTPRPVEVQADAYPGISGLAQLMLGGRGREFRVEGVLISDTPEDVVALEAVLLSYADGIARTFTDTQGVAWSNVVFNGRYRRSAGGVRPTIGGWLLPYECTLEGLS